MYIKKKKKGERYNIIKKKKTINLRQKHPSKIIQFIVIRRIITNLCSNNIFKRNNLKKKNKTRLSKYKI